MHRWTAPAEMRALMRRSASGVHSAAVAAAAVGRGARETEEKRKSGPPLMPVDLQNSRFMRQSISNYVTQAADAQNNVVRLRQLTESLRAAQLASLAAIETDDCAAAAAKLESVMEDVGSLANRIRLQLKLMEPQQVTAPAAPAAASAARESLRPQSPLSADAAAKMASQQSQYQSVGAAMHHALSRYYDLQCAYYKALQRAARSRAGSGRSRGGAGDRRPPNGADHFVADGPMMMTPGPSGLVDVQCSLYEQEMQLQRADAAVRLLHAAALSRRMRSSTSGGGGDSRSERDAVDDDETRPCRPGGGGGGASLSDVDGLAAAAGFDRLASAGAAGRSAFKERASSRTKHAWCKCALAFLFVFVLFCAVAAVVAATLLLALDKRSTGSSR